jgi:hypothetical protein
MHHLNISWLAKFSVSTRRQFGKEELLKTQFDKPWYKEWKLACSLFGMQ